MLLAGLEGPLEADVAQGGAGEGFHADQVGRVDIVEEHHAEEGPEDYPVELPEEGQLRTAPDNQAPVGEEDQDDAVHKVEEKGEGIEAHNDLSRDEENLAPEHPVFLPGVGVLEDDDQEGGAGDRSQDTGGRDTHQEAAGGAG